MKGFFCALAMIAFHSFGVRAEEVRIVAWNAAPSLYEALEKR